jgi:hypothetical protein
VVRNKSPIVECKGVFYVNTKASGIHQLVILIDGMNITVFKGHKREGMFLKLDDAIAWHEKELAETKGRSGRRDYLDMLFKARTKVTQGQG